MAKVGGIIDFSGKFGDAVYYRQRQNSRPLVRRVSTSMSKQLKEGENFANVRLLGDEFGACGKLAGAVWSNFSERQRAILVSRRTGLLTKYIANIVRSDTFDPIGKRGFYGDDIDQPYIDYVNTFAKFNYLQLYECPIIVQQIQVDRGDGFHLEFPDIPFSTRLQNIIPNFKGVRVMIWAQSAYLYYEGSVRVKYAAGVRSQLVVNLLLKDGSAWSELNKEYSIITMWVSPKTEVQYIRVYCAPVAEVNGLEYEYYRYASYRDFIVSPIQ